VTEETTTDQTEEATGLALFNRTDEALALLQDRLKDRVYDIATVKGMDEAKKDRAELRSLRVNLDKMRKQLNEDDQARIKARNTRAGEITAKIEALEDPIDEQIKAEETRKAEARAEREREEQQRLAAITAEISALQRWPLSALGSTAVQLELAIAVLSSNTLEQFDDVHLPTAQQAKDESLTVLNRMLAERRNLDERAAELAERNRLVEAEAEQRRQDQAKEDAERAERQAEEDRKRAERDAADQAERDRVKAEQDARQAELDAQEQAAADERARGEREAEAERQATAQREAEAQAERDRQAEAERQQAEADRQAAEEDARRARTENATLREAVEAVLAWIEKDGAEGYMVPDELVDMCRAALANDKPESQG